MCNPESPATNSLPPLSTMRIAPLTPAEPESTALTDCPTESTAASLVCSKPTVPRSVSQAARFSAGSDPTSSRIICQAAMLRAPSGGGPIAKETEHCGQKQIRCAADFCRGLTPTVCANIYTATDLCPASSSRLQRRQCRFPKVCSSQRAPAKKKYCLHAPGASR